MSAPKHPKQHDPRTCTALACRGVTPDGWPIKRPVDSERCTASVLYGDEQCVMTRLAGTGKCAHHTEVIQ